MDAEQIAAICERFDVLRQSFRRVDAVLTANAEGDTATNFKSTHEKLDGYRKALSAVFPSDADAGDAAAAALDNADEAAAGDVSQVAVASAAVAVSGVIRSREDVVRAIDAICTYYKATEPGSPVPLLLQRAREWIGLDFMAVLEDLVPGGVEDATRVLRSKRALVAAEDSGPAPWSGPTPQAEW
jgi:type VI secretion system protein ImpA